MRRTVIIAAAALMTACGPQADADPARGANPAQLQTASPSLTPAAAMPDLAACPARDPVEEGVRSRTGPIPVPVELREEMRASDDNLAFTTLAGATICLDASWMDAVEKLRRSPDGRFVSFDWVGYEAFGHVIVDRNGNGATVDTGVEPVASPSGDLLAAADLSESGFGALSAFAVWRIEPAGLRQLGKDDSSPSAADWRIERWRGEECIELTAQPLDDPTYPAEVDNPARKPYHARRADGWRLEPGSCPTR